MLAGRRRRGFWRRRFGRLAVHFLGQLARQADCRAEVRLRAAGIHLDRLKEETENLVEGVLVRGLLAGRKLVHRIASLHQGVLGRRRSSPSAAAAAEERRCHANWKQSSNLHAKSSRQKALITPMVAAVDRVARNVSMDRLCAVPPVVSLAKEMGTCV
jgi:hypothetical protein